MNRPKDEMTNDEILERLGLRPGDQLFEDREFRDGRDVVVRRWVVNSLDGSERQLWPRQ
jgi:hypothetical protein